jgi:hypothetical protein
LSALTWRQETSTNRVSRHQVGAVDSVAVIEYLHDSPQPNLHSSAGNMGTRHDSKAKVPYRCNERHDDNLDWATNKSFARVDNLPGKCCTRPTRSCHSNGNHILPTSRPHNPDGVVVSGHTVPHPWYLPLCCYCSTS